MDAALTIAAGSEAQLMRASVRENSFIGTIVDVHLARSTRVTCSMRLWLGGL